MTTPFERIVLLASGAKWPLEAVSGCLSVLGACLDSAEDRNLLFFLQRLCLGDNDFKERVEALQKRGLVRSDGQVDPVMKDVVLSAVRNDGRHYYLVSPFTDAFDRVLSDYLAARDRILSATEPRHTKDLLDPSPLRTSVTLQPIVKDNFTGFIDRIRMPITPPYPGR